MHDLGSNGVPQLGRLHARLLHFLQCTLQGCAKSPELAHLKPVLHNQGSPSSKQQQSIWRSNLCREWDGFWWKAQATFEKGAKIVSQNHLVGGLSGQVLACIGQSVGVHVGIKAGFYCAVDGQSMAQWSTAHMCSTSSPKLCQVTTSVQECTGQGVTDFWSRWFQSVQGNGS